MTSLTPSSTASRAAPASELARRLAAGQFVVTAEITPPVATDPADFIARALPLRGVVTALNITDGAGAKAHLSTVVAAHFLLQNGIEPIVQFTCRDRNRIALQNELIGALALGARNILLLRGDDPSAGDQPEAKAVFDYDTRALLLLADKMRSEHKLPPGTDIKGPTDFFIGAADSPIDPPPNWQPTGLIAKVDAGADFVQTQFCMDMGVVRRYAARLLELGVAQRSPILIGIAPIPSARSARWMKEKLYGTIIPDAYVERLDRATDPKAEGKKICVEVLRELATIPGIAGAHIMSPQFHSAIAEVVTESGVVGAQRRLN